MMRPLIRITAVAAVSAMAGWLLGKWWFPKADQPQAANDVPSESRPLARTQPDDPPPPDRVGALLELSDPSVQCTAIAEWKDFQSVSEVRSELARLDALTDSFARELAEVVLLDAWIRLDPAGILEYAEASGELTTVYRTAILWADHEPNGAIEALATFPLADWVRDFALLSAVTSLAASEPSRALGLLEKHQLVSGQLYRPVFAALAAEDVQSAARLAASLSEVEDPDRLASSRRAAALATVAGEWAREDPREAIRWLQTLDDTDGPSVRSAWEAAMHRWSVDNPKEFLAELERLPSQDNQRDTIAAFAVARWWREEPAAALAWVEDHIEDPELTAQILERIAIAAAPEDPVAAVEIAASLPESRRGAFRSPRHQVVSVVASQLCERDPAGTAKWIGTLASPDAQNAAAHAAVAKLAESDPAAAIEHFAALAPFLTKVEAQHHQYEHGIWNRLIPQLAENGISRAAGWIEALPPDLQASALKPLAAEWAREDPRAAAEYVASQPNTLRQMAATQEVIGIWASHEAADAARWVESLPEGQNRQFAATNVAARWAATDPTAASAWIESLPPSPSRDKAAAIFAADHVFQNPPEAIRFASTISDEATRREALAETISAWRRSDPAAAAAAADQLPLSDADLDAVRAGLAAE